MPLNFCENVKDPRAHKEQFCHVKIAFYCLLNGIIFYWQKIFESSYLFDFF